MPTPSLIADEEAVAWCSRFVETVGSQIYSGAEYRVSLLSHRSSNEWIEPLYRYQQGRATLLESSHICLRMGVPVAGLAWEKPQRAFILELPRFADTDELIAFYVDQVGIPTDQTTALRRSSMRRFRSILCVGLHKISENPLVLSVDCERPHAFILNVGGDTYVRWGGKLVAEMRRNDRVIRKLLKGGEYS